MDVLGHKPQISAAVHRNSLGFSKLLESTVIWEGMRELAAEDENPCSYFACFPLADLGVLSSYSASFPSSPERERPYHFPFQAFAFPASDFEDDPKAFLTLPYNQDILAVLILASVIFETPPQILEAFLSP